VSVAGNATILHADLDACYASGRNEGWRRRRPGGRSRRRPFTWSRAQPDGSGQVRPTSHSFGSMLGIGWYQST